MANAQVNLQGWPKRGFELTQVGVGFQSQLLQAGSEIAAEVHQVAVGLSPVGTGPSTGPRFRDSWAERTTPIYAGGASVVLGNVADHASYTIGPTRAHDIWANHPIGGSASDPGLQRPIGGVGRGLGYLKFAVGGTTFFRHMVHHPGTKFLDIAGKIVVQMQPFYQEEVAKYAGQLALQIQSVFS